MRVNGPTGRLTDEGFPVARGSVASGWSWWTVLSSPVLRVVETPGVAVLPAGVEPPLRRLRARHAFRFEV